MHSPQAVYAEYHRKILMRLPTWKKYDGSDIYLKQILEKTREYNITNHYVFIDFKAAYGSIDRTKLLDAMAEFDFPDKLIHTANVQ
jgi:hypothetical protein